MPTPTRVELSATHPGFADPIYRARRDEIAALAHAYRRGDPIPHVDYTDEEHAVWRSAWQHLRPMHRARVARELQTVLDGFALPDDRIPQLFDVSAQLRRRTGFAMVPVAGLVAPRRFLARLAEGEFLATQYVRHGTRPLYTPEPDVVHELVGHAATLADPRLAELNRAFGRAARRADPDRLRRIERVYWFTLEFGVCHEGPGVRGVGAGLLSSAGELARLDRVPLLPWDLDVIEATPYDTSDYQPMVFAAPSYACMLDDVEHWLATLSCARPLRIVVP